MQKKCSIVKFKKDCSYKDVAKEISSNIIDSWIYIHTKLLEKLINDNEAHLYVIDKKIKMFLLWQPTDEIDYVCLKLKQENSEELFYSVSWRKVIVLNEIKVTCDDPKEILFLELDE